MKRVGLTKMDDKLPDCIIIGAQRSGTTSLYHYLSQHPDICPSSKKEVHYFDGGVEPWINNYKKGELWYRSHFKSCVETTNKSIAIEASPLYLFSPLVPERMFELIPQVKIIAILRNPIERALSHYFHSKARGHEILFMIDAFRSEETRLQPAIQGKDWKSAIYIENSYKARGLYMEQIDRYLQFFDSKQIFIIESSQMFADPQQTLSKTFRFLGVDHEYQVKDLSCKGVVNPKEEVSLDVYEYLRDFFLKPNRNLYDYLRKDLGWDRINQLYSSNIIS